MIKVLDYEVKNTMNELTIGEFEKIQPILSSGNVGIFEMVEIFKILGVPEDEIDDMELSEFKKCAEEFNKVEQKEFESVESLDLEGYTYKANWQEEKLILPVKDLKLIQSKVASGLPYMAFMMGVIFKRTDLTNSEHYANAHIEHKAKLFRNLPAYYCVKYFAEVMNKLNG